MAFINGATVGINAGGYNVGDIITGSDGRNYHVVDPGSKNLIERNNDSTWEGGGGAGSYPKFNFDWEAQRAGALTQLTPYYEQKLKEAGGDVERAKRLLEEDYTRGVRISKEDLTVAETQSDEDLTTSLKSLGLDVAAEDRNLAGSLNNKGVYVGQIDRGADTSAAPISDYAQQWHVKPQKENQDLRKLAIERAVKRQKEVAGITSTREQETFGVRKTRGIEEQNIQFPRTARDLEEEKRQRAFNEVVPMKYNEEYSRYKSLNNLG